jgi:hypothetical protein
MEDFSSKGERLYSPETQAVDFFLTHKQFFLDTLEMSLLDETKKKKLIGVFNTFLEDLKKPDLVKRTMVVFDDKQNMYPVMKEDGEYDIYVASHVLFNVDYLGGELLSLFSEPKKECRDIYKILKDGFKSFFDD